MSAEVDKLRSQLYVDLGAFVDTYRAATDKNAPRWRDEALADLREQVDGHAQMLVSIRDGPPTSTAGKPDDIHEPDKRDALDDDPADIDLDDPAEDDDDDDPDWCDPEQPFLYFHDAGGILLKNPRSTH